MQATIDPMPTDEALSEHPEKSDTDCSDLVEKSTTASDTEAWSEPQSVVTEASVDRATFSRDKDGQPYTTQHICDANQYPQKGMEFGDRERGGFKPHKSAFVPTDNSKETSPLSKPYLPRPSLSGDIAGPTPSGHKTAGVEPEHLEKEGIEGLSEELSLNNSRSPSSSDLVSDSALALLPKQELSLDELASAINHEHQLCQGAYKSSLLHARKTGELLLEAKAKVKQSPKGRWLYWLETNCPDIPKRTAQVYMQVACDWEQLESNALTARFGLKDALKLLSHCKRKRATTSNPDNVNAPQSNVIDAQWYPVNSQSLEMKEPTGDVQPQLPSSFCVEDSHKQTALLVLPTTVNQTKNCQTNSIPVSQDHYLKADSESPLAISHASSICTTFIGSIESMNHEHITAIVSAIALTNPKKLELMGDADLKLLINKSNLIVKKAKTLLSLRRHPDGFLP